MLLLSKSWRLLFSLRQNSIFHNALQKPVLKTLQTSSSLPTLQTSKTQTQIPTSTPTKITQNFHNNEQLTVWMVYGTPLVNIFLWGSITFFSLQIAWYKLEFAEYKQLMDKKIVELEEQVEKLRRKKSNPS
ncbi:hypothetical protein Glove_134g213 [Diversispora epigaea]|uniref:Uncharacterized protein n=1 Tax=Diversispora epigaea TaxID=1348612 RepID=A0A397IZY7_9GLOM|nr:hypothetical protein Glove_134g213 [Diversispora epigaea]